jgi:hypothetical protein
MPLFDGVGPRIAKRLIALGYVRADGKPDVRRFCLERGYDKTLFYYWLRDRSTPMKERARLAKDLGVTSRWLIFGDEDEGQAAIAGGSDQLAPIAGGSDAHDAQGDFPTPRIMLTVRRRLHRRWPSVAPLQAMPLAA